MFATLIELGTQEWFECKNFYKKHSFAEKEPIVLHCLDAPGTMLTMATPDEELLAVRLFTVCFNVFTRWHQCLWFKRWGV